MHSLRYLASIPGLIAALASVALAVPTAVNDSYTTPEDTPVSGSAVDNELLNATFAAGGGNSLPLPALWDYTDTIPAGTTVYPVDENNVSWRAADFEMATSSVGVWKSAAMPLQGGTPGNNGGAVDGLTGPNILLGVTGNSEVNTVNTYLIRGKVTVTAAQATQPGGWTASVLADDAAIIYINGVEAGRVGWDNFTGTVNLDSLAGGQGSSETAFVNVPLTVPFVAGENTIAIELHQNSNNSSDAGIGLTIVPSSADQLQGLAYADDVDGTTRPNGATGALDNNQGQTAPSINVQLSRGFGGGGGGANVSGGWRKTITVPNAGTLRIQCDARARALNGLEDNEFVEAIVMLDGARLSTSGRNYLTRTTGINPAASPSGNGENLGAWGTYTIETTVTAGSHVLTFGGFGPRPSGENFDFDEGGVVNFDNIVVSMAGTAGTLLDNDTGGVAPVTAAKVTDPTHGTVTVNSNGTFTYTPELNYNGTDSFTYKAIDGTGESTPATVTITITPVNDPPTALADGPYNVSQGQTLTVPAATGLLANDTDVESSPLTAALATQSASGTATVNADGSFTFTPSGSFAGTTTFTYRASDGTAPSAAATVTINVTDLPDAPVAVNDSYTAVKNTPLVVSALVPGSTTEVIFNQGAPDWHFLNTVDATKRDQGTAWRNNDFVEDGSIWAVGAGQLGYGNNDEATVIEDDPTPGYVTNVNTRFATYYFRRFADIADFHLVSAVTLDAIYDDTLSVYFNGTHVARTQGLIDIGAPLDMPYDFYAQGVNVNNNSTVTWNLSPAALLPGTNLIACEVHQNANNSSDVSFDLRMRVTRITPAGVLANDSDPDPGQTATLTAAVVDQPLHGSVTLNADGTFTYIPANGYTGPDTFTYRATDSTTLISNTATVSITTVTGPNVAPIANADSYSTDEDTALTVSAASAGVLANDTDAESDPFTAVIATPPSHGTVTLNADGTFLYTPAQNYNGIDTFTYRANDGRPSAPATVTITIAAVNDAPVAANDTYSGDPGVPFTVVAAQGVLANDSDVDAGTALTAELVAAPVSGSLTLNPDGSFTFTAATGGLYSFTYKAKDAASESGVATVTIALNAVPVTAADSFTTDEDQPVIRDAASGVLSNDSDPESQPLTAQLVTGVQHGTLTLNADGSFIYSPALNFFGSDSFTYRASDGTRLSGPVTVSFTVNSINDAPVAANDIYGVRVDTALAISAAAGVLRNDTDVDDGSLSAVLISAPAEGTLSLSADGSFTYTPAPGFSGTATFTYRAGDGSAQSGIATVTLNVSAAQNTVMISEIMYNPPGANGALEEFIEIYNYGDAAIDLSGWGFTKGVNYTFPAGTLIAGKAYLAIPANLDTFQAKYPGAVNVTSTGWGLASSLANGGETIRLKNGDDETIDEVPYSDSGDWANRRIVNVWDATNTPGRTPANGLDTDPGLEWVTSADPDVEIGNTGGSSIQLINTALSNKAGANWTAALPTPGSANSTVAQLDSAPLIRDVVHSPAVPNQTQQVYVTARITDEQTTGVTASVFYRTWGRNATAPDSATYAEVVMADNGLRGDGAAGDGVFGAVIPAQALNTVVEFYVQAADASALGRTWPAPTLDVNGANPVQNANCLYQVNEEVWTDARPLYQLVLTGADNAAFNAGKGDSQSNVAPNCTVIFRQGGKYDVRYRSSIRARGNSSRSDTPINLRLDIPGDYPWNGRTAFTMNYKMSYVQFLASRLMECAGVPCEKAGAAGMRFNGVNRLLYTIDGVTNTQNLNRTFGYYVDLMPRGGETIKEWFPENDAGNGYGKIRGSVRWGVSSLPVIGANGWPEGGYVNEGYWKQTNGAQNDWTDLHALITSLNSGSADNFDTVIANTVDVDQWCRFLAVSAIINHAETNMANGDDDDYSLYFGAVDRLARIIPHDLDTCFNMQALSNQLGDENAQPTATIYQCTEANYPGGDGATLPQMDKFYRNPVLGRKYKAALRHYLNTLFAKPGFDAMVDELLDPSWLGTQFNPNGDAIRAHIKSFMDTRRTTIETYLPTAFTASTTLAVQNGYPRSTSATDLGSLGGKIDPARTAEVRVNGIKVTTNPYGSTGASDNSWSAGSAVTLHPGLNTLLCTAHDDSGSVFASQTVSIWLDAAGINKSGSITASETWTAAAGPYNVTGSITVASGATLTIEPGTTVFMASGTSITVANGGRLLAQGTAAAGITFARNPSGTGTWGNIVINGTSPQPNILSYVTFDNNGSVAVHGQNGATIEADHLTFKNTGVAYLSLDGCSFVISDCVFPDGTAGFEPVHGSQGILPGGRGIVQRCSFGKPVGYNDSMDFTGGNRPGPILQVLDCTFNGSEDDMLDLDSTDAWIEGCTFIHCHRNGSSPDSSSGVSGGADNSDYSQVTVINCLFYDCDNAVTMKQGNQPNGNSAVLLYNTIVHTTKTGGIDTGSGVINFDDDSVNGEAKGFYLEGNIIWDAENLTRNYDAALSQLTMVNNSLPVAAPATATASGNFVGDPLLNLGVISNPAAATLAQVQAALTPQGCSPVAHLGAAPGRNALRVQTPPAAWPENITLSVGPGGSFTPMSQAAWNYGFTHYRYSLDGAAESEDTAIATPLTLTGLSAGGHTLRILGRRDSGDLQSTPLVINFTVVSGAPTVSLSEVLADATVPDMIELHNWGTAPASLAGCTLSDDPLLPALFAFTPDTTIPAGGYLAVNATQLGFSLARGGETVRLYSGAGIIDEVTFGPQLLNLSIARTATGAWTLANPSPAAANTGVCELGSGSLVRINEWLGNNDLITNNDFVELYNAEGRPVNLAGWRVTEDYRNFPSANMFPALSFIGANGFLELVADGDRSAGTNHLDFKVSSIHDSLSLLNSTGALMDHVFVLPGNPDSAQGRTVDGGAAVNYLALPTPGFSNASDTSADVAVMNGLRVTEIMFAPPGGSPEFVEFKNISTSPLTVSGVSFDSGISFTFPALTIPSGGFAVITNSLSAFTSRYPGVTATQWTSGRLDNGGETLRIETGTYGLGILEFGYDGDWYPTTRTGASLEIIDPAAARTTWSDAASWQPCVPSPGGPSIFGVLAPEDMTVAPPGPAILSGFVCPGPHAAGTITVAWEKVSGPGTVTFTAPANKDTDASFSAQGEYVLRITATPPAGEPVSDTVTIVYGDAVIPIVPGNGTLACNVGGSAKVTAAALAALATGGNAPLSVASVQTGTTATGASVSLQDGWIVYEPLPGVAGIDSFTYTLTDGSQSVTGTVTVVITVRPGASVNIAGLAPEAGGMRIGGSAIPGRTYGWQTSSDLQTWSLLDSPQVCPANGVMSILDPGPLPPTRYYRLVEFAP